jgi:hypothetical protein
VTRTTPARLRALAIIRDNPGIGPTQFARLMWPDSKGHRTRSNRSSTPAGGAVGAGIKMSAGAFLRRLGNDGLIGEIHGPHGKTDWYINEPGRKALEAS